MSDILAGTGVAPSEVVASAMGVSRSLLHTWSMEDSMLSGCIIRRTKHSTWWSVGKLRERGYLDKQAKKGDALPDAPPPATAGGLADDLVKLAELCLVVARKLKEEAGRRK